MQAHILDLALGPAAAPVGGRGGEAVRVQEVRWRDRARVQGRIQVGELGDCNTQFSTHHSPGDGGSSSGHGLVPGTGSGRGFGG